MAKTELVETLCKVLESAGILSVVPSQVSRHVLSVRAIHGCEERGSYM